MAELTENKWSPLDGVIKHNPVFIAGMSIAPAVIIGNTFYGAVTYASVFSAVTFVSLMIASFLPRKLPYALRIILYTLTAAAVYVPAYFFLQGRLPDDLTRLGVFLPMIVTGEFVVNSSELRFFRMKRGRMTVDIISHIIGFDIAIIFLGIFREVFATGGINGELYGIKRVIPILSAPCGGFILIGFMGALIRSLSRNRK